MWQNYPQEFTLYLAANKPVKAYVVIMADGGSRNKLTAEEIISVYQMRFIVEMYL